ncbi:MULTISPECIES: SWIM zinc finger family protein [Methylosinus]|uniref:SWIM zinc finger family protein n=1 Tax=Methylosinus TaxID=425 RepID=UPI0001D2E3AB|nr:MULTISPECIES: SWIM zinc finger family protein [Methylosinus]OBS53608.1 hypothetical protein A8B73_05280 [Methylosinus sp. 3S-1]
MSYFSYPPYVPVAQRRAQAAKEVTKLKKKGRIVTPVVIEGRKIAQSFWGTAWCDNLERYSDFESRLPRGRTYVRNGSVIDLQIAKGKITSIVSGSEIYTIEIAVTPATTERWKAICRDCAGSIGSLVELLKGKISKHIMERVCREGDGLFPSPREIKMSCSCPDGAHMCKHVAAALYGVGARLDAQPELLFLLRGVDSADLVSNADAAAAAARPNESERILAADDVAALFGIDMAPAAREPVAIAGGEHSPARKAGAEKAPASKSPKSSRASRGAASAAPVAPAPKTRGSTKSKAPASPSPVPVVAAEAKARSKTDAGVTAQKRRAKSAPVILDAVEASKEDSGTKGKRAARRPSVAPPDMASAPKATSPTKKPEPSLRAAAEGNKPSSRRGTQSDARTRAAKWIGAKAKKSRG